MILESVVGEFRRYKVLAEGAFVQVQDGDLWQPAPGGGNSIGVIAAHIAGNLRSRFTDFLGSDGEKPWRDRESEFAVSNAPRAEMLAGWNEGWEILLSTLAGLGDADLPRTVKIRGVELSVIDALHRSLAHVSYHVGQIVLLARSLQGDSWRFLTIPPGGTAAYNQNPAREKPPR